MMVGNTLKAKKAPTLANEAGSRTGPMSGSPRGVPTGTLFLTRLPNRNLPPSSAKPSRALTPPLIRLEEKGNRKHQNREDELQRQTPDHGFEQRFVLAVADLADGETDERQSQ